MSSGEAQRSEARLPAAKHNFTSAAMWHGHKQELESEAQVPGN